MKHIPHIEDLMFEGVPGFEKINRVFSFINQGDFTNFTIKIDGAPAVFFGIDPNDNCQFVAKKSIFNVKPVIYKSYDDIGKHISNQELIDIMKLLLDITPKVPGVYQGDFLFAKNLQKTLDYSQEGFTSFHPNTIVYSVDNRSDDILSLESASMGLSLHTYYSMDSLYRLTKQKFIPLELPNVYQLPIRVDKLVMKEVIPTIRFIQPEHDTKYYNSFIRKNEDIPILSEFDMLYHNLGNIKEEILKGIISPIRKSFKTKEGYIETTDEGLVYSDLEFSCKIVNRRHFSYANFNENFIKGWS